MGALGKVLLTGANGFVGRATLEELRARGCDVVALHRSAPPSDWTADPGILPVRADLSDTDCVAPLVDALSGVVAVIHAAAAMSDDGARNASDTVAGTRHLLSAMSRARVSRLVLVSSLAVYDPMSVALGGMFDEAVPVETPETARDGYVRGKLEQEALCRAAPGLTLGILRPGIVYGPGRAWNAHIGVVFGPILLRIGIAGELPMVHVDHLARALADAAGKGTPMVVNLVDDDRPDRGRFLAAFKASGWPRVVLPLPRQVLAAMGWFLAPLGARRPGLLKAPVLRWRMAPYSYANAVLHDRLGFTQSATFETLMQHALTEKTP